MDRNLVWRYHWTQAGGDARQERARRRGMCVMRWGLSRRAPRALPRFRSGVLAVAMLAPSLAGCTTSGSSPLALAQGGNATVAFESIDGPPRPVFQKLVASLDEEARSRKLAVVSREGAASYRVRGYLSVHVERSRSSLAWVFDVYDGERRRAVRIGGEEPLTAFRLAGGAHDAWSAADDAMLRRIARNGVERLANFLQNPSAPAPAVAPPESRGEPVIAAGPAGEVTLALAQ
jgi:hypothetical protein